MEQIADDIGNIANGKLWYENSSHKNDNLESLFMEVVRKSGACNKLCHSPLLLIHFIVPVIGMILFVWYYSSSAWNEFDKVSAYIQIVSVSFPSLIGITTSILAESEQKAGGFQMLLSTATPKYIPHFTKLIIKF